MMVARRSNHALQVEFWNCSERKLRENWSSWKVLVALLGDANGVCCTWDR